MGIDFETAIAMQKICTGETIELKRGKIVGEVIDIDKIVKNFKEDRAAECREFYDKMVNDNETKMYDVLFYSLMEVYVIYLVRCTYYNVILVGSVQERSVVDKVSQQELPLETLHAVY